MARGVSLSPDGQLVAFLRPREDDNDVQDLWAAPVGPGEAYKLIDSAQARWRAVNAPHLVALVRAGAVFHKGKLLERPFDITPAESCESNETEVA